MGHFRTAAITGALLLAGLTPVIAQTESCTVPARQILENPSFETGSLAPWEAVNTCASCGGMPEIVEDKENAHDGSWVFRQSFYDNIVWHASQPVAIESPGEPHNISLWYRYDALPGITVDDCGIRYYGDFFVDVHAANAADHIFVYNHLVHVFHKYHHFLHNLDHKLIHNHFINDFLHYFILLHLYYVHFHNHHKANM
ncbi:hypothetical protein AbraIFM66951_002062 [Aspergillus brasiliensis]|uniref:Uncharacterized protein n=1 Tax=Aspergillus brasiliensis TaxID=319629 RepID=A0A9W5Z0P2_9EURO|nr:hypothetical protein AbraCBS73388_001763 [Aspergillus brasiliensis]GKZ49495.1 hypothetical protein AbraIFM66951_002062 [Aspergillus brasiliensis]